MEWSGNVLRYGIGYFRRCAKIFGTVRIFRNFFPPRPRGPNMIPVVNFYTGGYCFGLMQCNKILGQGIKMEYKLVML